MHGYLHLANVKQMSNEAVVRAIGEGFQLIITLGSILNDEDNGRIPRPKNYRSKKSMPVLQPILDA